MEARSRSGTGYQMKWFFLKDGDQLTHWAEGLKELVEAAIEAG